MGVSHCLEEAMRPILIIPGYRNSGASHWQTLWEGTMAYATRVPMPNWDHPHRNDWMNALDDAIERAIFTAPPILVAHDIGCMAVAHWVQEYQRPVHAALLVAPTDPERADAPEALKGFAPVPLFSLPFTSHVVASSTDPFVSIERAREFADAWRSAFTNVGPRGHLNGAAGFGEWPRGEAMLKDLLY
jgi:predicted alpha/beta hydrolase family esterase